MKNTIVSGITPSAQLTIGNYLGAIKNFLNIQKNNNNFLYLFIADLHAITGVDIIPKVLHENIQKLVLLFYACGLKSKNTCIFLQSQIQAHCHLNHLLMCHTTIGELSRMTQFKDKKLRFKKDNNTSYIPSGLLTYPVLMAADILLYDANLIPVGKDQKQHVELTRNIAQRFNKKYQNDLFVVPDILMNEESKIMDLQNPLTKMSKSTLDPNSYILIMDNLPTITRKIKKSITDSENKVYFDVQNKPGVSNLLTIYCGFKEISIQAGEKIMHDKNYGEFKSMIISAIWNVLSRLQTRYHKYANDMEQVKEQLKTDINYANHQANHKVNFVMKQLGFYF